MARFAVGDRVVAKEDIVTYYEAGKEEINAKAGEIGEVIDLIGLGKTMVHVRFPGRPSTDCFDFEIDHVH